MTEHETEHETGTEQPEQPETEQTETEQTETDEGGDGDTFTRDYVTGLRREAAQHRTRATEAEAARDALADELWAARVTATGRLVDPSDLPRPTDTDATPDAVDEAVTALLESKPHLARRRVGGSIGQGEGTAGPDVSLSTLLRQGT